MRFFIINETTEIFKCDSRNCLFPFRNFIFRDRKDQSFFTIKQTAVRSPPSCSPGESIRDYAIEEQITTTTTTTSNDLPSTSKVEEILCQLFPDDDEEAEAPSTVLLDSPIPLPEREKSKSPPKVLSKTFDFLAKRKLFAPSFNIQPKNIKSPLDLVKSLLKCKEEPLEEQEIQTSLAEIKVKAILPVLKSPPNRRKQQLINRPLVSPPPICDFETAHSHQELPSLDDVEEDLPKAPSNTAALEVKQESSFRIKAEPADKTSQPKTSHQKARKKTALKKPLHSDVDEKPLSSGKVKTMTDSKAASKASSSSKVIKTEANSSTKPTPADEQASAQDEKDAELPPLLNSPVVPSTTHTKRERKATKFYSPEVKRTRKRKTETVETPQNESR